MRAALAGGVAIILLGTSLTAAPPKKRPAVPTPPAIKTEPIAITCPDLLGQGVKTGRSFCEVVAGGDQSQRDTVALPKHSGIAVLRFHLHNRQVVSTSLVKTGRAYTRATATIGALAPDGALLGRGVVQTEFRREADLFDRVSGGAGPGGLKAVAPVGDEVVVIDVPEKVDLVSLLGEKVVLIQVDGLQTVTADGHPIALVSSAQIEYRPVPPKPIKPAPKRKIRRK